MEEAKNGQKGEQNTLQQDTTEASKKSITGFWWRMPDDGEEEWGGY